MIRTNYLQTILYWLIVASLIAPLVAFRHYFSDPIFFKTMAFFIVVDIMIVVYGVMLARGQIEWPKSTWLNWSVLGLVVVLSISLFTSTQPYVSFWGTPDRIMGCLTWFHLSAYFYIVSSAIKTKTNWIKLLKIIILSSIFVSLYALGQYFNLDALTATNSSRVSSGMTNPLFLAGYYMVITPLTTFFLWFSKKTLWRIVSGLALVLQLFTIVATVSRSPVVALAVASVFTIFVYAWTQKSKKLFRQD